jgi:glucose/arabinose dehydrogenase
VTGAPDRRPLGAAVILNIGIIAIGLVGIAVLLLGGLREGEPEASFRTDLAVRLETVASGFDEPLLLVGAGDGSGDRLVVEQRGTVRRLALDGSIDDHAFLDIRDRVLHHQERGLLGLALHPDHAVNGRFFVLYSRADDGATVISEFGREAGTRLEDSERVLLTIPATSTLHKGGMLAFDREGQLLVGIGDGSTGNDPTGQSQDRASLLGKLLRLDVDSGNPYGLPPDNGFADVPGARPEIHALGLRNPWRFSVDPVSGHVYIGDVGQATWEEIDVLAPGADAPSFGWADMEGGDCFYDRPCEPSAHVAPTITYAHIDDGVSHCGVVGGDVYEGVASSLPADTYFYADYCSGTLWVVPAAQLREGAAEPIVVATVPAELGRVRSFGQDDDGELYLLTSVGSVVHLSEEGPAGP